MRNQWLTLVAAVPMALLPLTGGAKGCLKGAAVGGVAGHVAGHHAIAGAAVGCVIGHHHAKVKAREAAAKEAPQAGPAPPGGAAQK
jgi:hypothetical protein